VASPNRSLESLTHSILSLQVGNFIQYMATFVGGYIVAYVQVWRLALPGWFYNRAVTSLSSRMQSSYNKAGAIAEESISSVRTVYSFVGETKVVKLFSSSLDETVRLGIKQGFAKGLSMGSVGINFAIWAFLGWYGSEQILAGRADGGNILTTGIAIISGGM
jgi:ATP-binding cassette subfamily B (MDR/TAP) protein 1